MAPRIVIVGGGSYQWVPTLVVDIANTPSLHDVEVVLEDIDPAPLGAMVGFVEHVARLRGIGLTATGTTDQRAALDGADFVVVCISTGALESMAFDVGIPAKYGIRQPVGDSVGPGGIVRSLRNVPVLLGIARDMVDLCPDAWLLNLTNPMTTLCRAVSKETPIRTVGLCHEIAGCLRALANLLECEPEALRPTVTGVNHLPIITALDVDGRDGLRLLRGLLDHEDDTARQPLAIDLPEGLEHLAGTRELSKGPVLAVNKVKFELFRRFGALPAAGDRHLVEFFPGFLTEESGWGKRWGVEPTTIEERHRWLAYFIERFEQLRTAAEVSTGPSGELVGPLIDSRLRDDGRAYPLNIPNRGHCPDLPPDVVVEAMCAVDAGGVRGRDAARAPAFLAECLRRISASQEMTVDAALTGDRGKVFEAMLADPLAGCIDFGRIEQMTDEMLTATARWLPQFA